MIVNAEVEVARPRDQVFDLMADARNEARWNSAVSRSELLTGEPIGLGTEYTTTNRGQEYLAVVTTYERPDRVAFSVVGKVLEIAATMQFTDSADGTTLDATFDLQPKSYMKVLMPLAAGMMRKEFPKQLASFKRFCESYAGA